MTENFYDREMSLQQEKTARTPDMVGQREALFLRLNLQPGEDLLEVGCGNGIFLREARDRLGPDSNVVGIDYSPDMIELSRSVCPNAVIHEGSATNLPVKDEQFDVASMAQVLCFVDDSTKAVRELYRSLKPGGRVVILDTHWDSLVWNIPDNKLNRKLRDWIAKPYIRDDIPSILSRDLTDAGFVIDERTIHPVINWSLETDSYSGQLIEYFKPMANEEGPSAIELLDDWVASLRALSDSGGYHFSICRYIFCATKPR